MTVTFLGHPMPDWVTEIRTHQIDAAMEVLAAYQTHDVGLVVLDAPTGSGKTLIGEMVRAAYHGTADPARGLYLCHGKELQRQFVRDFDAPLLMGRANYPTIRGDETITADDCTGNVCSFCPTRNSCPYEVAKQAAINGNPAVLNTAYFLSEANGPGRMSGRELVVVDECDTLEGELGRWAEFVVTPRQAGSLTVPRKSARWATIIDFLRQYRADLYRRARNANPRTDAKAIRRWNRTADSITRLFLQGDVAEWARVYDRGSRSGALILKPVTVERIADQFLWRHGKRWLLMSATVVGAGQMVNELGWEGNWHYVKVPSTFPVENRPIFPLPVADMSRAGKESGGWERCARAVRLVMDRHPDERILVHTVSYQLAQLIGDELGWDDRLMTYRSSEERAGVLDEYRLASNGVLLAPSMDRGVDLPDDLCRVMVVAKLPFPYLGDQQVSARLHGEDGDLWYTLQTIRSLVQMTGRGVRHSEDRAITYILDRSFIANLGKYRKYLPDWWTQALILDQRPSAVLPGLQDL